MISIPLDLFVNFDFLLEHVHFLLALKFISHFHFFLIPISIRKISKKGENVFDTATSTLAENSTFHLKVTNRPRKIKDNSKFQLTEKNYTPCIPRMFRF